jgi:hypothetical protein
MPPGRGGLWVARLIFRVTAALPPIAPHRTVSKLSASSGSAKQNTATSLSSHTLSNRSLMAVRALSSAMKSFSAAVPVLA